MKTWKKLSRVIFILTLLTILLVGASASALGHQSVSAAPMGVPLFACPATTIAQWTFTGNVSSSTGNGTFSSGSGLTPVAPPYAFLAGTSIYFGGWNTAAALDPNDYLEFQVDTSGYDSTLFKFDYRSTNTGPNTLEVYYSTDGTSNFIYFSTASLTTNSTFHSLSFDLSSIPNNSNAKFRIYAYGGGAGNFGVDNVTISDICILPTEVPTLTPTAAPTTIPGTTVDLSITSVTVNNSAPNVNDSIVFTVTVNNATGADLATNSIVTITMSAGLTYVSDNGGAFTTNPTPTTIKWSIPSLAAGSSTSLKITEKVTAAVSMTNSASVAASLGQTDSNPTNNSLSSDPFTPNGGIADLSLTQTYAKASPGIAGYIVLTTKVTNVGPYNATNVVVKDDLPTGLTYVSDDSGGAYNKTTGLWSAGAISYTLPGGDATKDYKTLNITAKVDPTGTMLNEAEVWSANQSPSNSTRVYGNGSTTEPDYDSVTVESADLSITKVMDNVTPTVGTDVVFTIRVTNAGPNTATNVVVKDLLSANYTYLSDDSGSGGTYIPSTGEWHLSPLPSGTSRTLKITATVLSTTAPTFTNWAEVWASDQIDIDSVPGDSSQSSDDDASAPAADLRLEQADPSPAYPALNTDVKFKITVFNDGTVGATGVQVKDKLPSGLTYKSYFSTVSIVGTVGVYTPSTGYWVVGALANGASETLTITAQMPSSGVRTNWAEVWKSDLADPDSIPGNNSTTEDDDASATVSFRPILINEVAWSGTVASTADQWIELYNPSLVAINISGWTLKSSTKSASGNVNITLNGTIAAGGYFLLERDNNNTVLDITANQIYTGALLTSGETLTLRDNTVTANVIDTANIEGFNNATNPWPRGGGTHYASMERVGNSAESDSVWVANTGVTKNGKDANGDAIYGTPGKKNSTGAEPTPTPITIRPTAIPIVRPVINEFLPRPGTDWNQDGKVDVFDEFIEIKNIGITDVNLKGWQLDDEENGGSSPFEMPSLILKPGQHAVFYGLKTNIQLSDGGDTVRLLNPDGKIYDAHTYAIAAVEDKSVCRLPDGNGTWYEDCFPTPNLINSREGVVPSMPGDGVFESPNCDLPDTLPADFLFAECRGYGAGIWHSFYWDKSGWQGDQPVSENMSKWESFVE